ncbi:MAG: hypothetical protein DELT_00443 [Desulfovibrio sp.]
MKNRHKKRIRVVGLSLLGLALIIFCIELRVYDRVCFGIKEWQHAHEWRERSLWLPQYQLALSKKVAGINKNLSGLTWNHDTRTLFAIVNRPPIIAELSTDGELLRTIKLRGFHDTESLEYLEDGKFVIAEEQKQQLSLVVINAQTTEIHANETQQIALGAGNAGNNGLEGLTWDFTNKVLYAGKERRPVHIYEVSGFCSVPLVTKDIEVGSDSDRDRRLFVSDLSGLEFHNRLQHLLVLSDTSKIVIEVDKTGQPISSLSLIRGNGLPGPVPQAEGIAMDDDENLYLVSEPNLFYVFTKPAP